MSVTQSKAVAVSPSIQKKLDSLRTISAKIRYLDSLGTYSRGQIARTLGIRYQHVRNVLITPVKNPQQ